MPRYIDQPIEEFYNKIYVGNLPSTINGKQLNNFFRRFGHVIQMKINRNPSKLSATLKFEYRSSIDQLMANRPHFIDDQQIFVNRCLPITRRYPYEPFERLNRLVLRPSIDDKHRILPQNERIQNYFNENIGGNLIQIERLDDETILIQFDDYDPVDLCCLLRPHFIDQQIIEVEKCSDEQQIRRQVQIRAKTRSLSKKLSTPDVETQSNKTISPSLSVPIRHKILQIQNQYAEILDRCENEHEKRVNKLKTEWKTLAFQRIRFERLTFDYQDEFRYFQRENRQLKGQISENVHDR